MRLTPSNQIEDVRRMQQETEEAHSLLSYLGGTPMIPFTDVRTALHLGSDWFLSVSAGVDGCRRLPSCSRAARNAS